MLLLLMPYYRALVPTPPPQTPRPLCPKPISPLRLKPSAAKPNLVLHEANTTRALRAASGFQILQNNRAERRQPHRTRAL